MKKEYPEYIYNLFNVIESMDPLVKEQKGVEAPNEPLYVNYLDIGEQCYGTFKECHDELGKVEKDIQTADISNERREYLDEILQALDTQCKEGMGKSIPFRERVNDYIGVPGKLVSDETIKSLKEKADEVLANLGFKGSFGTKVDDWYETVIVPRDEIHDTAQDLLETSRELVNERLTEIPEESTLEFETVTDVSYGGRSDYFKETKSAEVKINIDSEWSLPELKKLLAHEGYGGHFGIKLARHKKIQEGGVPPEKSFFFARTPYSPIAEGTCNLSFILLDWFESIDDYIGWYWGLLGSAAITNMTFLYYGDGYSKDEVMDYYIKVTGASKEKAERRFRAITRPLYSSLPHYWYGTSQVYKAYQNTISKDELDNLINELYGDLNTFTSIGKKFNLEM